MNPAVESGPTARPGGLKLWHLALLVGFVAVAIADIKNHGRAEPVLIVLAGVGFAAYGMLGWVGWWCGRRFEGRVGRLALLVAYFFAMALLFFGATIAYLLLEYAYLNA